MSKPSFFGTPSPRPPELRENIEKIDRAAAELGFVSREATPISPAAPIVISEAMPVKRRKPVEEPTFSFTARVSVRSGNAFIKWCEEERITYREGFDRLMAMVQK
jgi:hypothetical protein